MKISLLTSALGGVIYPRRKRKRGGGSPPFACPPELPLATDECEFYCTYLVRTWRTTAATITSCSSSLSNKTDNELDESARVSRYGSFMMPTHLILFFTMASTTMTFEVEN